MTCNTTYKLTPKCKCGTSEDVLIKFEHKEVAKSFIFTCSSCKTKTEATLSRRLEDIKAYTDQPRKFRILGKINTVRNVIEYPPKEEIK